MPSFSDTLEKAIHSALAQANTHRHELATLEHLLLALIDEPDAAKASRLQKEISDLQSQFDQKRINHMVEMRKLNPQAGRGFMAGGSMMGYGSSRGGNCW